MGYRAPDKNDTSMRIVFDGRWFLRLLLNQDQRTNDMVCRAMLRRARHYNSYQVRHLWSGFRWGVKEADIAVK